MNQLYGEVVWRGALLLVSSVLKGRFKYVIFSEQGRSPTDLMWLSSVGDFTLNIGLHCSDDVLLTSVRLLRWEGKFKWAKLGQCKEKKKTGPEE